MIYCVNRVLIIMMLMGGSQLKKAPVEITENICK